jgi:hypothetical protein
MVASVLVVLAWQLLVAAEAARTTATGKKLEVSYPSAVALISALWSGLPRPIEGTRRSAPRAHAC